VKGVGLSLDAAASEHVCGGVVVGSQEMKRVRQLMKRLELCARGAQRQGPYQKGIPLKAGEALSLSYWLMPDPSLPPREFRVRTTLLQRCFSRGRLNFCLPYIYLLAIPPAYLDTACELYDAKIARKDACTQNSNAYAISCICRTQAYGPSSTTSIQWAACRAAQRGRPCPRPVPAPHLGATAASMLAHGQGAGGRPRADARRRGQVALTAFYQTADGADVFPDVFATTFFNQTIDIVETNKLVDVELISLYATIAALLAGLGARPTRARID